MKKWEKAKRRGKAGEKLQEGVVQPRPLPALAWPNAGGIPTLNFTSFFVLKPFLYHPFNKKIFSANLYIFALSYDF